MSGWILNLNNKSCIHTLSLDLYRRRNIFLSHRFKNDLFEVHFLPSHPDSLFKPSPYFFLSSPIIWLFFFHSSRVVCSTDDGRKKKGRIEKTGCEVSEKMKKRERMTAKFWPGLCCSTKVR